MMDTGLAPLTQATVVRPSAIALIDCSGKVIGVDASDVREVIPAPPDMQPLPSSVHGVVGCLALRGLTVPVVDFSVLLGWQDPEPPGIIVVLRHGSGLFAFRAHGTRRIVLSDQIRFQDVDCASSGPSEAIFPRIGLMGEDVVAMLSPKALAEMGVPLTRDTRPVARSSDISEQYLLFEMGSASFVLPVARVDGTVPETEVVGETMVSGPCEGAIRRLEIEMPLINPLTMTGMGGAGPRPRLSAAIVLKFPDDKRLALRADRVRDIIQIKRSLIAPLPRILSPRGDLFSGVVALSDHQWYHVLDPDGIAADPALRAFAGLTRRIGAEGKAAEQRRQRGRRGVALLFRAGGDFALPIEAVEEVVNLPRAVVEDQRQDLHLCNIAHRNQLLPIFSLSQLLGTGFGDYGPLSAVIVTTIGTERVGLAVEEMVAIERQNFVTHPDQRSEGMVERPQDGKVRLFSVVDRDSLEGLIG